MMAETHAFGGSLAEGKRLFALKRWDLALKEFIQVKTGNFTPGENTELAYYLGLCYTKLGRFDDGLLYLEQVITAGEDPLRVYQCRMTLAYAAWARKNSPQALELYEKALEIDENNTTAMNGIGYILVDTNRDVMRGLRLCRKAVDMRPQNAAYLDSLGWAYYKSGNSPEAKVWIRRALDLAPGKEDIRKHMRIIIEDMK
jgi:tetratricopeptide (TPR) repeat protein